MTLSQISLDVSAIPDRPAGAGRYVLELVRALGVETTPGLQLLSRRGDVHRWHELAPSHQVRDVVPTARPVRLAYERVALSRQIRRLGVDVHHAPHYTMPGHCRVPVVVTVHDLTFFDAPELHERSKVAFFTRAIRRAAAEAAAIVCVSERTSARLRELCEVRGPVVVAPHGVDHERFGPEEPSPGSDARHLASLGLDERRAQIVYVGTLEPRKGLLELLDAFGVLARELPELDLVLVGQRGWGLEAFDARLASSPARGRIHLPGYVPDAAIPALLRRASVVAYPSIEEGFGLPALEALACGAPLVTTLGSVMAELCGDAPWLVAPGDARSLVVGLREALGASDPERAKRRALGLGRAQGFSWPITAERHLEAYELAASRGRPKAGK
jgi:glycosyltransferase involved in cell wall biosynthesis